MKYKIKNTKIQIEEIQKENQQLRSEIKSIKNDVTYQDLLLRQLGYMKTNEILYKFQVTDLKTNHIVKKQTKYTLTQRHIQILVLVVLLVILILLYVFLLHFKNDNND